MGDVGARLLAKALQINNKLRTIILDRNNITLQGTYTHRNCSLNCKQKKKTFHIILFPFHSKDSTILSTHWRTITACEIFHFRCLILRRV